MVGMADDPAYEQAEIEYNNVVAENVARRTNAGVSEQQNKNYEDAYIRNLRRGMAGPAAVEAARQEAGISEAAFQEIFGGSAQTQQKSNPTSPPAPKTSNVKGDTYAGDNAFVNAFPKVWTHGAKTVASPYTGKPVTISEAPRMSTFQPLRKGEILIWDTTIKGRGFLVIQ